VSFWAPAAGNEFEALGRGLGSGNNQPAYFNFDPVRPLDAGGFDELGNIAA